MAQPLYWLPNLRQDAAGSVPLRRAVLRERGLGDVFADVPFEQQSLWELPGRGPGDAPGCLLCYQAPSGAVPRRLGYYPDEQTWQPVGDGSLLWIGIDSAEPPKPEEMARPQRVRGYALSLGDGNEWAIPVVRRHDPDHPTLLPCAFTRDAAGRQVETVRNAYRPHWEAFRQAAEWVYGGMPAESIGREEVVDLAVRAIGINYRFGWQEQNALQVIDSENYLTIVAAAVDLPSFNESMAAQKKMNYCHTEQSTTPGRLDGSQTTRHPGATCT